MLNTVVISRRGDLYGLCAHFSLPLPNFPVAPYLCLFQYHVPTPLLVVRTLLHFRCFPFFFRNRLLVDVSIGDCVLVLQQ